jgi:hypothetical protein
VHGARVGPGIGERMCGNEGGGGQVVGNALPSSIVAEKEKGEEEVGGTSEI